MTARVEIDWEDIERGDSIRVENKRRRKGLAFSVEYVASYDGFNWYEDSGYGHTYYLLERPTPAVELPDVPTLGWLSVENAEPILGRWRSYEPNFRRDDGTEYKCALQDERDIERDRVTGFAEAVVVPLAVLDKLRSEHADRTLPNHDCDKSNHVMMPTCAFLTAVDNASTR